MAERAGGRSILFGSGAPEPLTGQSRDMFRMPNPRRFEQGEMDRSLRELAGHTVPLRLESFQDRKNPKDVWRGIALGVKSFKTGLSEHNVAYLTEDKQLGIAFPEHVEIVTLKGLGDKRQTHMELVGQRITNTMEHTMLVGLAKRHLERGKPLDMKWLQDTFQTTSVEGLKDIMELDQQALKKHIGEAWVELAFGKVLQPMKDTVNPIREKIVATRNAVTAKLEQMAERKMSTKQKAVSIAGIVIIGSPLVAGCVPTTMSPETPTIPSVTEMPSTPIPTETKVPTDIPIYYPTETGPESKPEASVIYPQALSVEQVQSLMKDKPKPMSGELLNDPGVKEIVARHTEWVRSAGLNVDVVPVTTSDGHWFIELQNKDGSIAGWLKIADTSSQSGWRYGEQPTYDSQFKPSKDKFTFGLPALHNKNNHFEILYQGFPILVEMNAKGEPQYWNNIAAKEMQKVEGAKIIVAQEFKAGITPEMKYEDCNQLHEDTLTAELTELVTKEHAWLDAQGVTASMIAAHGMSEISRLPLSPYESARFPTASQYLTSCSVLHMNNGTDMFLLGIAVRNNLSDNIAILHFGIDDTGLSYIAKGDPSFASGYNNYYNSKSFFDIIKNYTKLEEFYRIAPQIFIPFQSYRPEWSEPWQNTVKYMEAYYKGGSIVDYYNAIGWNTDEKAIINIIETMVIPTRYIPPGTPNK
ncbi:MAG: hypothetical protein V1917_02515 [Candidatus Gottesmanbacteria bacterium]